VDSAEVVTELMHLTASMRRFARRAVAARLAFTPLPEAQRELLFVVEAHPGIGIAAAAADLGLAGNSVSTLVNALVEAGLLTREIDTADRRAARLMLTDAAMARLQRWRQARGELLGRALDRTDAKDRAAIEAALPALRRLHAMLTGG
jgi:DNA-binding MarR family transcriptional regulator